MRLESLTFNDNLTWLALNVDDVEFDSSLLRDYQLDEETIEYARDKNERPHIELDGENQDFVLIFNALDSQLAERHYKTLPLTFVVQKDRLLTLYHSESQDLIEQIRAELLKQEAVSCYQLLFMSLELISEAYFKPIDRLDKEAGVINDKLRERTQKKELLALSDIETSYLYLVSAVNQNALLLEQIKKKPIYRTFTALELEQLEDAVIETAQLTAMLQLNAQVLDQLSGTYNNILNNNLNDTMSILTVLSVLLAILAVITGFFGMNVPLPFEHTANAWLLIIVGCAVLWFGFAFAWNYFSKKK